MRMRKLEKKYPDVISKYYKENGEVTDGLDSFNKFIADQEKIRKKKELRIERASEDGNEEVQKDYENAEVEEDHESDEGNEETMKLGYSVIISAVTAGKDPRYIVHRPGRKDEQMRMRELGKKYSNVISKYYKDNGEVIDGLGLFNNFITDQEEIRKKNELRIEGVSEDGNNENADVEKLTNFVAQ